MNINDLTLGQLKEITSLTGSSQEFKTPFKIGKAYLFRTVTHIDIGVVIAIDGQFATINQASWIADTGRFHDALKKGSLSEVEPYPTEAYVNLSALCDAAPWNHYLPKEQK